MIIWLASYPKSGNTFVRSMLSAYLFSQDGKFSFELLNEIKQFPDLALFKNLGINISDKLEIIKNYIYAQEEINKKDGNSIRILKTHAALHNVNGFKFTNLKNSIGAIYIVRDPRKVVKSFANHNQITIEDSLEKMSNNTITGGKFNFENKIDTHVGSWSSNYNTWKEFKKVGRYLLVKYEDLTVDPEGILVQILDFIYKVSDHRFVLNKSKLKNVLETTNFENLKKMEEKINFPESVTTSKGKSIFFKYGKKNTGQNLPVLIKNKIEENFKLEMKELNYW